jgi:hypothetical protein
MLLSNYICITKLGFGTVESLPTRSGVIHTVVVFPMFSPRLTPAVWTIGERRKQYRHKQSTPAACESPRASCFGGWLLRARGAAGRPAFLGEGAVRAARRRASPRTHMSGRRGFQRGRPRRSRRGCPRPSSAMPPAGIGGRPRGHGSPARAACKLRCSSTPPGARRKRTVTGEIRATSSPCACPPSTSTRLPRISPEGDSAMPSSTPSGAAIAASLLDDGQREGGWSEGERTVGVVHVEERREKASDSPRMRLMRSPTAKCRW